MKFFSSVLIVLLFAGCFKKQMTHLEWHGVENKSISGLEFTEDSDIADTPILNGKAGDGSNLRVFERKNIKADGFDAFSKNLQELLVSYYKEYVSPYPGAVSKKIECSEDLKLRTLASVDTDSIKANGFLLYANDRYSYGSCDPAELKYEALHVSLHCKKQNKTYELKYFIPKSATSAETLKAVYAAFSCS